jgi:hypothetical protein
MRFNMSRDIGVLASGLWGYFLRNPSNNLEIINDLVLSMRSLIYEHDLSLIYTYIQLKWLNLYVINRL